MNCSSLTVTVTVTEALVLRPLVEDRWRITESIRILVPVDRMKQKCFQITTKYCAPVWHYAITRSQAEQLESIQKRAIQITGIYPFTRGMSYSNTLFVSKLTSLESRRRVTNFQGHSFKISLTHPLPSIIYSPLHVICLSCLGSERPHVFAGGLSIIYPLST